MPPFCEKHNRRITQDGCNDCNIEANQTTVQDATESLLKEATAHLRIALGMHQMTFDERSPIRGDIREFIKKVETRTVLEEKQ